MTKILVVEDQVLVRDAIATLLSLEDDLTVIGKCSNGQEAIDWLEQNTCPDIILTDIEMPHVSGIALAEQVLSSYDTKVIIMTTFAKPGYISRSLKLGVSGFILKEANSDYLIASIKKVISGKKVVDPELAMMALEDKNPLSTKEGRALELAGQGVKTQEISQKLFLSEGTVRNYLSDAIAKLNATNRIDAYRIAKQKGWL
ncbi:response regulator transcription factor [Glaciecola sp. 1036]|uniref:response regulator transcription factor n=1 Tax=Alteromonadaceae TaxID=72275 RepID=UPI003CFE1642